MLDLTRMLLAWFTYYFGPFTYYAYTEVLSTGRNTFRAFGNLNYWLTMLCSPALKMLTLLPDMSIYFLFKCFKWLWGLSIIVWSSMSIRLTCLLVIIEPSLLTRPYDGSNFTFALFSHLSSSGSCEGPKTSSRYLSSNCLYTVPNEAWLPRIPFANWMFFYSRALRQLGPISVNLLLLRFGWLITLTDTPSKSC